MEWFEPLRRVHSRLPTSFRTLTAGVYNWVRSGGTAFYYVADDPPAPLTAERRLVKEVFDSRSEYDWFVEEFHGGTAVSVYKQHEGFRDAAEAINYFVSEYDRPWQDQDRRYVMGLRLLEGRTTYCLVRKLKPDVVVETGVANGWSTLCVLSALEANDRGHLYSIDYPQYESLPYEELQQEDQDRRGWKFHAFGRGTIPNDKEPGWVIPSDLKSRWTLKTGKSQQRLPELVAEVGEMDLFIRDTGSDPALQSFELESAWANLDPDGGVVIADDVRDTLGWHLFTSDESVRSGFFPSRKMGYAIKDRPTSFDYQDDPVTEIAR